jgi:hypothetical protein
MKTCILRSINFVWKLCHLYDNVKIHCGARQATEDNSSWRMPTATDTHSEYVIIIALPRQWWLHKRASLLHYVCIACLVLSYWGATIKYNTKLAENDNRYSLGGTALCVEQKWSYCCQQRYRIHICLFCMVDHMNLNNKEMSYEFNYTQVFNLWQGQLDQNS